MLDALEKVRTGRNDVPLETVRITDCGLIEDKKTEKVGGGEKLKGEAKMNKLRMAYGEVDGDEIDLEDGENDVDESEKTDGKADAAVQLDASAKNGWPPSEPK